MNTTPTGPNGTDPNPTASGTEPPQPRRRPTRWSIVGVALAAIVGFGVLAAIDIAAIDPTSGGYEPPYTDYDGDPIDWDADTDITDVGMVRRGYVLHTHTDCTTGMIRVEVFGLVGFDYRQLSDRALAVHDPHGACEARGFEPAF